MFLSSLELSNCNIPWVSLINFSFSRKFPEQITSTCSSTSTLCTCKVSSLKCYCSLTSNPSKFSLTSLAEIHRLVTGSILPHRSRTWSRLQSAPPVNWKLKFSCAPHTAHAPKKKKEKRKNRPTDRPTDPPAHTARTLRSLNFWTRVPTEQPII
jgi:hypothetical protein